METLHKKSIFLRKMIVILSTILIISSIIVPIKSHANIVNYPDTDFLDVTSPIVLEFDRPIQFNIPYTSPGTYNTGHPGIQFDGSNYGSSG